MHEANAINCGDNWIVWDPKLSGDVVDLINRKVTLGDFSWLNKSENCVDRTPNFAYVDTKGSVLIGATIGSFPIGLFCVILLGGKIFSHLQWVAPLLIFPMILLPALEWIEAFKRPRENRKGLSLLASHQNQYINSNELSPRSRALLIDFLHASRSVEEFLRRKISPDGTPSNPFSENGAARTSEVIARQRWEVAESLQKCDEITDSLSVIDTHLSDIICEQNKAVEQIFTGIESQIKSMSFCADQLCNLDLCEKELNRIEKLEQNREAIFDLHNRAILSRISCNEIGELNTRMDTAFQAYSHALKSARKAAIQSKLLPDQS